MKSKFSLLGSVDEKEVFDRLVEMYQFQKYFLKKLLKRKL